MSKRTDKVLSLVGQRASQDGGVKFNSNFTTCLADGMHGIGFSPYREGQEPGDVIEESQIHNRMEIIAPYTQWIRSFSCTDGNELVPKVAQEMGLKTMVGAWLGKDLEKNEAEIEGLIQAALEGHVDIAAVGNEVMYRGDLTEEQLLNYIDRVKKAIPNIPVGYVDAYYEFEERPNITEACDLILANCYPFWEGCHLDYSLLYMKDMYKRTKAVANGKKVIITETGWPNTGESFHGAIPSHDGAIQYFLNTQQWSKEEDIDIFYFSSFDESWKTKDEGNVGAYWGLWDANEKLKY